MNEPAIFSEGVEIITRPDGSFFVRDQATGHQIAGVTRYRIEQVLKQFANDERPGKMVGADAELEIDIRGVRSTLRLEVDEVTWSQMRGLYPGPEQIEGT